MKFYLKEVRHGIHTSFKLNNKQKIEKEKKKAGGDHVKISTSQVIALFLATTMAVCVSDKLGVDDERETETETPPYISVFSVA